LIRTFNLGNTSNMIYLQTPYFRLTDIQFKISSIQFSKPRLTRLLTSNLYFQTPILKQQKQFKSEIRKKTVFYNLFLVYLQNTLNNSSPFFKLHTNFQHLFLQMTSGNVKYLNVSKIYNK